MTGQYIEKPPKWDIRSNLELQELIGARIHTEWARINRLNWADQQALLLDTRRLHRTIFSGSTPPSCEIYAGEYRGTAHPLMIDRYATLTYSSTRKRDKVYFAPPNMVAEMMSWLGDYIKYFTDSGCTREEYIHHSVQAFVQFNKIHPYLDGNGRISRILFALILAHKGIQLSAHWTLDKRPFNTGIDLLFRRFDEHPEAMENYLKTWLA